MPIPNTTTLSYGNFTFPATTETKVDIQPVLDSANRSLKYNSYILTARCRLNVVPTTIDDDHRSLPGIFGQLTSPGRILKYLGKGFGDLTIDGSEANLIDIVWGPIPKMISWSPLGTAACDFTWRVEFHLANCDNPTYAGILSLVFSESFSHDSHGYTTRTYSGSLEIPRWKKAAGFGASFDRTPDEYLERVIPAVPFGYRVANSSHSVDESKTKLTFSVTHEQVTNPLPDGIVEARVSHTTQNSKPPALVHWTSTLSASYTVDKGVARSAPLKCFIELLADRLRGERQITENNDYPIIMSINLSEPEVHGRRSFQASVTWLTIRAKGKEGMLVEGLWRPVPNTSELLWKKSLENTAWHPRGLSRVASDPKEDVVVSICSSDAVAALDFGGEIPSKIEELAQHYGDELDLPPELEDIIKRPSASESFLKLVVDVKIEPVQQTAVHVPLPLSSQKATLTNQPASFQDQQGAQQPDTATPRTIVQFRGSPLFYLRLTGTVIRAGYPVQSPTIVSYMGVPVVDVTDGNRGEGISYTDNNDGADTIYRADWNLRYVMSELPESNAVYAPDSKDSILSTIKDQNRLKGSRGGSQGGSNTGGPA